MATDGKQKLDHAVDKLEREVPGKARRFLEWARSDKARWVRIPLALLLIAVGLFLPYLPILGVEDIIIGLLLLSYDIPFLRKPMAAFVEWAVKLWRRIRR
ncbi:hypothetical protein GTP41_05605 [Pseudoduganella sp. DS3]|uniref:Uncharacterized protein n=1 Tax=Pseudoduganella guangdongensis TaxID=2692179 RepID=A0A6N9HDT6_9BURK|nr:hypothetical protein [Pseudoduganella guangdongensis]MYN01569.1 hypothetical protein [Pseudoduganella guangdongensis]